MNSKIKSGITLLISAVVITILVNVVGFSIYNSLLSTTVINEISLNQMNDDAVTNTISRVVAEGGIWKVLVVGVNILLGGLIGLGIVRIIMGWLNLPFKGKE